ncbi:TPA: hypothetical protein ACGB9C_002125 [Listeria monocytogenes]
MTQTKAQNTIDETYKELRNKLKNDEEITESDLKEALKLYEKTNRELKKAKNKYRSWTEDEDDYLIAFVNANDAPVQDAADFLERTYYSVHNRIDFLRNNGELPYKMRPWRSWEDEFIEEHYKILPLRRIAEHLNRSRDAVKSRVWALGLTNN